MTEAEREDLEWERTAERVRFYERMGIDGSPVEELAQVRALLRRLRWIEAHIEWNIAEGYFNDVSRDGKTRAIVTETGKVLISHGQA